MTREHNNKCNRGLILLRRYQRPLLHLASSQSCFEDNAQTTRDDQQQGPFRSLLACYTDIFSSPPAPLRGKPYGPACKPEQCGIGLVKGVFIYYRKQQQKLCCLTYWFQLPMLSLSPSEQSWTDRMCRQSSLKGSSCNPNVSQLGRVIHMGTVTLSPAIMSIWWDWKLPWAVVCLTLEVTL